jgi:peptidoglycan hydrolase-like protein with peptidoglycan-binding domain
MSYSLEFEAEPFGEVAAPADRCRCGNCQSHPQQEFNLGSLAGTIGRAAANAAQGVGAALGTTGKVDGSRIIDLTAKAAKSKRKGTRDPKSVYALVLHQMGCCANRKDPLNSYLQMGAHFGILRDGRILQLHPVSALVWASNGFNDRSVAVEFAGNFPNAKGKWVDGATAGKDQVTPAQVEAGRYLIRWLMQTMNLTHVLAHRQSSGTRENDPGPDIWFNVGQWAVDTLKLRDGGAGFKIHTGNAIPDEWRRWKKPLSVAATSKEIDELDGGIAHEQWETLDSENDEFELLTQESESDEFETRDAGEFEIRQSRFGSRAPARPASRKQHPMFRSSPRRPGSGATTRSPGRAVRRRPGAVSTAACNCPHSCPQHGTESGRWVQSALNHVLGLSLPVDGRIDAATRSAIRSFQEQRNLTVDGIAGPEVERALIDARASGGAAADDSSARDSAPATELFEADAFEWEEEVDRDSRDYIAWVQRSLNAIARANLVEDGISGTLTRAAVRSFQRSKGLTADSIVGPNTEAALLLAGASPPPGSASTTPGTPYGGGVSAAPPTASPSGKDSIRDFAAQIAQQERLRWNNGALKESDAAAHNILVDYWMTGVGMNATDAKQFATRMYHWSAAFISWVMRKAGAGSQFAYSSYHSTYIAAAYKNQAQGSANPFKAYTTAQVAPRIGDLVCTTYESGIPTSLPQIKAGTGGYHCNIVVAIAPGKLTVMGGNLSDSVGVKTVNTDARGYVTDSGYFAVLQVK